MLSKAIEPIQVVSLLVNISIMAIIVRSMIKYPKKVLWNYPMFLWMLHTTIFYILLFIDRTNDIKIGDTIFVVSYTQWSSILRLHGLITILSLEYFRLTKPNLAKRECRK